MRGRRVHRTLGVLVGLAGLSLATVAMLGACGAIVGVQDVTLRRDSGIDGQDDEDALEPQTEADIPDGPPPMMENVLEVALGQQHTCARKPDLSVKCWGDDSSGQTGTGGAVADAGVVIRPTAVTAINDAVRIAAGQLHTCIVHKTGTVSCWGENQDGQLGDGNSNTRSPIPVAVKNVTGAIAVACGANFSCALTSAGKVFCWGNGLGGQLGTGMPKLQPVAEAVSMLNDAIAISAGESHACAVKRDGTVVCWGDNVNGQLGLGDKLERQTPTALSTLSGIASVAAGSRSTCALKSSGGVLCWGANEVGQLGTGAANASPNPAPTQVVGVDAKKIWAGKDHACAVKKDGSVSCWGAGFLGQIGDGQPRASASTPTAMPTPVSGVTSAIGVGTGGNHSCAPTATGGILCWGDNAHGEDGNGASGNQLLSPDSVQGYP